nr:MAG TPA: hypothetical protein [Caudoviricetes sp.]
MILTYQGEEYVRMSQLRTKPIGSLDALRQPLIAWVDKYF